MFLLLGQRSEVAVPYHIGEVKSGVTELEVFEEGVERETVE